MTAQSATSPANAIAVVVADEDPNGCVVPTYLIRELLEHQERLVRSAPNENDVENARRASAVNAVVAHCRMILAAASASADADMLAETVIEWLTEETDR